MTQAALQVANGAGASVRAAVNAALMTLATNNAGATAPTTTYGGMFWADTGSGTLWRRKSDNSAWLSMGALDSALSAQFAALSGSGTQTFNVATATVASHAVRLDQMNTAIGAMVPLSGGSLTGPVNANKGTDIPSAATVAIGTAAGEFVNITGTTTITGFDTVQAGTMRELRFTGVLTLTHNATSLILNNNGNNITTAAGDSARFRSLGSGNWVCVGYTRANGAALAATPQTSVVRLNTTNGCGTTNTKYRRFTNVVSNTGSDITYADSAANGASFTVNNAGVYAISYSDVNTSAQIFAITLNDNQPTTVTSSTTPANVLAATTASASGLGSNCSWTGYLPAGSVINAKSDGTANSAGPLGQFSISRIA